MAKISETGQAVLVANFQELIQHCQNFGGQYNPSVVDLQIGNLQVVYANTAQQLTDLHTANAEHRVGVAERMEVYKPLSKLGTRLRNAVKIHDLLPSVKEQIVAFTGKMQGAKKKKTTAAPTTDTNIDANLTPANGGTVATTTTDGSTTTATVARTISTSQMSYDQRANTLGKIIQTLSGQRNYQPFETDLQVGTLGILMQDLLNKNRAVTALDIARQTALTRLRGSLDNLSKMAAKVKAYIKSVFGANSVEYKRVSKIRVG